MAFSKLIVCITVCLPIWIALAKDLRTETGNNNHELDLDELKQICFPPKNSDYGRKGTTYVTLFGNEVDNFLQNLKNSNVSSLHISVKGATPDAREKNQMDLSGLQQLHMEELWIVPSKTLIEGAHGVYYFKVKLTYTKDETPSALSIRNLYIHVPMDEPEGLVSLIETTKHLNILSLIGVQSLSINSALSRIVTALTDQPIAVLRLDQYQSYQSYDTHVNSTQLFGSLQNSPLQCLSMRQNEIRSVSPGITELFPKIRILDLSYNNLLNPSNEALMVEVLLLSRSVELINLSTQGNFQTMSHNRYKRHSSKWTSIPTRLKNCLERLNTNIIEVARNRTIWCRTIQCLNVSILNGIPCSSFPEVQDIIKALDSSCYPVVKLPISPNLKELYVDYVSPLLTAQYNAYDEPLPTCFASNNLKTVTVSHNAIIFQKLYVEKMVASKRIKGLTEVSFLDLSSNKLQIFIYNSALFKSLPGVKKLYLQGNYLNFEVQESSNTSSPGSASICESVFPRLSIINLSNTNISFIPINIFKNCSKLTMINLAQNNLDAVNLDMSELSTVKYINLSFNRIRTLGKVMRQTVVNLARTQEVTIDLSGNQMLCDCTDDSFQTIRMIQNSEQYNISFYQSARYVCIFMDNPNQILMDVNLTELKSHCLPSYYKLIAYISVSLLLFLFWILLVWFLHKYRYHIYTWYYRCKHSNKGHDQKYRRYKYDAFISYCVEDRFWVHDVLMKTLQNHYGFKLVIHLRDFQLGEDIDSEIVRHMSLSRSNVIIISDNSVKKLWPEFELKRAYTESHLEHKPLIVVKFGSINTPREELSGLLQQILDSKVYNEWPEISNSPGTSVKTKSVMRRQELFWAKLAQAIYGTSQPIWGCGRCKQQVQPSDFNDVLLNDIGYAD